MILWVCPVMFGTRIFAAESLVLCGMLLCIPMTLDKKFVAAIILGVLFLNSFVCARARVLQVERAPIRVQCHWGAWFIT